MKNANKVTGKYYLGFDIGTNSVGWAVTDENYNLCKFKKKSMWGIRLFEDAKTAEERRGQRASRRRLQRRKQRIDLLQEIFAEEINKVDETFFIRLNESRLHLDDKTVSEKHPLFIGSEYSEKEYYREYPTIFHLRKELMESSEPHDIRLVYLAIHHILKNRGHFLIDGELSKANSFDAAFYQMKEVLCNELDLEIDGENTTEVERTLRDRNISKSDKVKLLAALLAMNQNETESKETKKKIENICKLLAGNKGDISKIFGQTPEGVEKTSFSFGEADYDESIRPNLEESIPDQCFVIDSIKALYDWNVLADILNGQTYLSCAKVNQYETHKNNLKELKLLVNKYCSREEYKRFFKSAVEKANYSNYIGSAKQGNKIIDVNRCAEEDFYKELKRLIGKIEPEESDRELYERIKREAEEGTMLPLQRNKDNSVVPNQVHKAELALILENAGSYIGFLNEKDEDGLSPAEKIIELFSFRIPYYVGPLSDRHKDRGSNSWIVRKAEGRILPWNFDEKVDREKSNEAFIERMTNKCTYLLGKDVVAKNSLIYSRFMVLNELNNLSVCGNKISVQVKQDIYRELFQRHTKVSKKMLLQYCREKMMNKDLEEEDLSGFDGDFKAKLSSYLDFEKKVFGAKIEEDRIRKITEDIIRWKTIYGDDGKMLQAVVEKEYPGELDSDQLKAIKQFRYSGWGNFSEAFLNGIVGTEKSTGQMFTIIEALWETNCNLMQLLSKNFTFMEEIKKHNRELAGQITDISYDKLVKDLYISPANKRAVWQTVRIAEEVKKIMGCEPAKIFVEMARGGEKEKKRTTSRKKKLLDLYAACKKDARDWNREIEDRDEREFNSDKLYLYYTQMGRCMYSGEHIDLHELMSANSKWDIDHIYPQSKVKDDSLDNRVLSLKKINNEKGNKPLSRDIQQSQQKWWTELLRLRFITKKKYDRLMHRGELSEEELSGFISRQLVETRQSTKAAAELLGRMYNNSKVVYVKASLVSQFRKDDLNILKSRLANDYHHAKDAYLNIVVGNVYNEKFTDNPLIWIEKHAGENYSINRVFDYDIVAGDGAPVWVAPLRDEKNKLRKNEEGEKYGGTIEKKKKTVKRNDVLYTEHTYCGKAKLFDEILAKKGSGAEVPLKKGLSTEKYGGYKSSKTSYFAVIEFDGKKGKRVKNIMEVPIYIANILPHDPDAYIRYCENINGLKNVKILRPCIKKNALISVDGYPMRICNCNSGKKNIGLKNNLQPLFGRHEETVRRIEKYVDKNQGFEVDEKFDGLNEANLTALYDDITEKLCGPYVERPSNQGEYLMENREKFLNISLKEKAKLLAQMIKLVRCDNETKADLTSIGASKSAGVISVNKNTLGGKRLILINQSVTGLFENRIEL